MKKVCVNPNLKGVGEWIKSSSEIFNGYLSPVEVLGLLNSWIEETNSTDFPSNKEFMDYYTNLASQTKQELFKNTPVSKKEDALDLIQSLYFEGLRQASKSPIITRKIAAEHSKKVLDKIPLMMKAQGLTVISDRWLDYQELFIKSRLKSLSVPIDVIEDQIDAKDTIGDRSSIMDDPMGRASDEVVYMFASLASEEKEYGLFKPINFSYAYAVTSNLLGGTTTRAEQIEILEANKEKYPFVKQLLEKMGYPAGNEEVYSPVRVSFTESFAKAAYDFTLASSGPKQSYSQLDLDTRNTLLAQYRSNFYTNGFSKKHLGHTILNNEKIKPFLGDETAEGVIAFLNAFGIPAQQLSLGSLERGRDLMREVKGKVDKGQNLTWIVEKASNEELGIEKSPYLRDVNAIVDELAINEKEGKKLMARNADGESQYSIANHNYYTTLWSKLKQNTAKVLTAFERLFTNGDIKASVAVGLESENREKGKNFNKLSLGELYVAKFSNMFSTQPSINLPVTSDKSMARANKFKKFSESQLNERMAYTMITRPLWIRLYEAYERDLNQNFHPDWTYGSDRPIDFWHGKMEIKDTKGKVIQKAMDGLLGEQSKTEKVTPERFEEIITKWLNEQNMAVTEDLYSSGAIKKTADGNSIVKFTMPNELGKYELSQSQKIARTVENFNFNELLFGIENTQLMYGSMVGVKIDNFFKRNAGGVAEGRTLDTSIEFNNKILAQRGQYPFDMTKYPIDKLRVFIHSETIKGSEENLIEFNKAYKDNNLDDAQGTMPLEMYKEILERTNSWTPKMDKTFNKVIRGQKLTKDDYAAFPPMKPVGYSLVVVDGHKIPVYIKTAVYPIFKTDTKGTLNEKKYDMMRSQGIGLVIPKSGIKMAVPTHLKALFKDGEVQFDERNMVDFPLEDFKIQLDINEKTSSQNLMGTQQAKLKWTDLFTDGAPIDPKYKELLDQNINSLQGISDIETKRLEDAIGIVKNGDDYTIKNYSKLVEYLRDELLNRDVSTNTIEAVRSIIDSDGNLLHPIDGLPSRQKLMNLLNSTVTNRLIKLYINGSSLVQLSQHGFELSEIADPTDANIDAIESSIDFISAEAKRNYYRNKGLSFFSLGKKTGAAEILLPAKYRKNLSKDEDGNYILSDDVLVNIGYRIPTQGHNSMLHLRVVGFLPEHYDQAIVMPKEITTQGGSDFDVDKINIFVPNTTSIKGKKVYITSEMKPEVVWAEKRKSIQAFKDFVERHIRTRADYTVDNMTVEDDLQKAASQDKEISRELSEEEIAEFLEDINLTSANMKDLEKEIEKLDNKEHWMDSFRLKQYQNEIIAQTVTILEDQAVQSALLTPNSADKLKKLADDLPESLKTKMVPTYRNLFSGRTLTRMAYQMAAAKSLVAVFASQSTNHALAQQVGLHVKTGRPLYFDHNQVNGSISLSGVMSKDKSYRISEMLGNQLLTGAVDAAKEDYLTDLGINLATGDFASAFFRVGGSKEYLVAWLKSPLIQEYLKQRAINDSLMNVGFKVSRNRLVRQLLENTYGKDKVESEYILDNFGYKREGFDDKALGKEMASQLRALRAEKGQWSTDTMLSYAKSIDSKNDSYKTMALQLFDDFLYFEDFSSTLRGNISNTKFDTVGPGKTLMETTLIQLNLANYLKRMRGNEGYTFATLKTTPAKGRKKAKVEQAPYDRIITDTLLNVFYTKSGAFVQSIYKDLVAFNMNTSLNQAVVNLINPTDEDSWVGSIADPELADLVYSTAINYLIQNQKPFRKSLFYGDNTVAHRIKTIQSNPQHPLHNNYIIERIFKAEPSATDDRPSIITIADKSSDAKQASYITQMFQEIKDYDSTLYRDLIEMNLYQTGVVQSPSSFYSFLPYEDNLEEVNGALTKEYMYKTFMDNTTLDLAYEVIANLGSKMNNLKYTKTIFKNSKSIGDLRGIITLPKRDTGGNMFIAHSTIVSKNGDTFFGQYMRVARGEDQYMFIPPKNMGSLFYNLNVQENNSIEEAMAWDAANPETVGPATFVGEEPDQTEDAEFEQWYKEKGNKFKSKEWNEEYYNECVRPPF